MPTRAKSSQSKGGAARRTNGRSRTARRATSRQASPKITELEQVIRRLEARIADLTSDRVIRSTVTGATGQMSDVVNHAVTQASDQVGEMIADSLTNIAGRVRSGATSFTGAARVGTGAIQKIGNEIEKRPLMTVAIALGIGFLAAMAGRREAA